jgi:cathepsin D
MNNLSFNLGQTSSGSSQCVGALAALDVGLGTDVWLLGDRYLSFKLSLAAGI